jgi:4'-phosphopantetheinyl transferase
MSHLAVHNLFRQARRQFDPVCAWSLPNGSVALTDADVHVWRIDVGAHVSRAATLAQSLAPHERERAARFRRRIDGHRYLIAHAALRDILARYLNGDPRDVVLWSEPGGKPELASGSPRFNMSHSHDLVVVAISATHVAGVDVELVRRGVGHEVTRCFSPKAFARLELLPEHDRTRAFFQAWTRMEAYAKARGDGLTGHIDALDLFLRANGTRALREDGESDWWLLHDFTPRRRYVGTVVTSHASRLEFWRWDGPRGRTRRVAMEHDSGLRTPRLNHRRSDA